MFRVYRPLRYRFRPGLRPEVDQRALPPEALLRGSWDLVSRVISKVSIVISTYNLS